MFGTLLGALPRPPLPDDADPAALLDAVLAVQVEHGLEPLVDTGWSIDPADAIRGWRASAARTDRVVKAALTGPFSAGIAVGGSVAALRDTIAGLADAGCPYVEVHEPAATSIGADGAERARFADLHERLLDGLHDQPGLHLSLVITGGSAHTAGTATILDPPYQSLAVDLIDGPDAWYLVRAAPPARGIVCGALSTRVGSDDTPELLMWAASYAATSGIDGVARGPARVGLATAGSLAALAWDHAMRKLDRLRRGVELASLPPAEALAVMDPRAVDIRSAALGRYEPRPGDRRPAAHDRPDEA